MHERRYHISGWRRYCHRLQIPGATRWQVFAGGLWVISGLQTAAAAKLDTAEHLDHSGYLPLLVKEGFSGRIFASSGTRDLCKILLPDSGHIQEEDAEFANRHGFSKHAPALPLYTRQDALDALPYILTVLVLAGFVGKAIPPRAGGEPYVKER